MCKHFVRKSPIGAQREVFSDHSILEIIIQSTQNQLNRRCSSSHYTENVRNVSNAYNYFIGKESMTTLDIDNQRQSPCSIFCLGRPKPFKYMPSEHISSRVIRELFNTRNFIKANDRSASFDTEYERPFLHYPLLPKLFPNF